MSRDKKQEANEDLERCKRKNEGPPTSVDQKGNAMTFYDNFYLNHNFNFIIDKVLKWKREEAIK